MSHFFFSKWFTILAILIIAGLGLVVWRQRPAKLAAEKRAANLEKEISTLEQKNSELVSMSDYFKSDAYLEKEAKLKLNVKKPDEQAVFIKEDTSETSPTPTPSPLPFWKKWLQYIFDND